MPEWLTESKDGGTRRRFCWGCGAVEGWQERTGPPRPYLDWLRAHAGCEGAYADDPARFAPVLCPGDRVWVQVRPRRWLLGECLGRSEGSLRLYRVRGDGLGDGADYPLRFLRLVPSRSRLNAEGSGA